MRKRRIKLTLHDGSSAQCFVELQISSKGRYGRNHDDHLVLLAISGSTNDALNHGRTDLVLDRLLLIAGSSDEELVLDVDEVLAVFDDLTVSILDGMLANLSVFILSVRHTTNLSSDKVVAPFGRTAGNLAVHPTPLRAVFCVRLLLTVLSMLLAAVLFEFTLHLLAKVSTSTVSKQPSLTLLFTTKSAFTLFFAFQSSLLHRRGLLSSAASVR